MRQESVNQLRAQWRSLRRDLARAEEELRQTLAEALGSLHTDLYPLIARWAEGSGGETFSFLRADGDGFASLPLLSGSGAEDLGPWTPPAPGKPAFYPRCQVVYGPSSARMVLLAVASGELQVDFSSGTAVLPVFLFGRAAGVCLLRRPGLSPAHYGNLVARSAALASSLGRLLEPVDEKAPASFHQTG